MAAVNPRGEPAPSPQQQRLNELERWHGANYSFSQGQGSLSADGKTITHQANAHNTYLLSAPFTSGINRITLQLTNIGNTAVGVVGNGYPIHSNTYLHGHSPSWCLYLNNGQKYHNGNATAYTSAINQDTTLTMVVDMDQKTLEFIVNNVSQTVAFNNLQVPVYAAVSMYTNGATATIVSVYRSSLTFAQGVTDVAEGVAAPDGWNNPGTLLRKRIADLAANLLPQPLNILLMGQFGSGKSSFINTVLTAFGDQSAEIEQMALVHGSEDHVTTRFKKYPVPGTRLVLWDVWGWMDRNYEATLGPLLDGHLKEGFGMNEEASAHSSNWLRNPRGVHMPHAIIFFVSAKDTANSNGAYKERLRHFSTFAKRRGYQGTLLLTKVDLLERRLALHSKDTWTSEAVRTEMAEVHIHTGFNLNSIFPCKLYHNENVRSACVEALALNALWHAAKQGRNFVASLPKEEKGE